MNKLSIHCEYLVCIPTGLKIMTHVIFKPTDETVDNIRKFYNEDMTATIEVNDVSGGSTSKRLHIPVAFTNEHGHIVLTTREL